MFPFEVFSNIKLKFPVKWKYFSLKIHFLYCYLLRVNTELLILEIEFIASVSNETSYRSSYS